MLTALSPAQAVACAVEPEGLLDEILDLAPGTWTGAVLAELEDVELDMCAAEKYLIAWDRQLAFTQARRAAALARAAGPKPDRGDDWGADKMSIVLGVSPGIAAREVETCRALAGPLRPLAVALEHARVSWRMVTEFVAETGVLRDDARTALVQRRMLEALPEEVTLGWWRRRLRREVLRADVAGAEQRHERAKADRRVETYPLPDGMASLWLQTTADGVTTVKTWLTALARSMGPDDPRTMDQRRVDALVDVARAGLTDPKLPTEQGRPPRIQVTGGIATLLGLAENPAELIGYGPIPPSMFRALAADGDWVRFTTAPDTGALIAVGTQTYRPNQALRDFLVGREPTCSGVDCPVSGGREIDHADPYDCGGPTHPDNTGPPCKRHHRGKTVGGFQLDRLPNGAVTWKTPAGTRRTVPPYRQAGDDDDEPE